MAVALGGDCLADAAVLRAEPALFGPVASDPVIARLARDAPAALKRSGWPAIMLRPANAGSNTAADGCGARAARRKTLS